MVAPRFDLWPSFSDTSIIPLTGLLFFVPSRFWWWFISFYHLCSSLSAIWIWRVIDNCIFDRGGDSWHIVLVNVDTVAVFSIHIRKDFAFYSPIGTCKSFTNPKASHELIRDYHLMHSVNTMNVAHLAKLFPTFFFFLPPYSESTMGKSGKHSPAALSSGLAAARAGKSRILATRVVFPKTPNKHTVPVAPLAEAFRNSEMKSMNFWSSFDVKFTHVPALQRCTAATFILRIGLWNQCICALNVFSGCGEKFMLTFNSGKSSLNLKQHFGILRACLTSGQDFSRAHLQQQHGLVSD